MQRSKDPQRSGTTDLMTLLFIQFAMSFLYYLRSSFKQFLENRLPSGHFEKIKLYSLATTPVYSAPGLAVLKKAPDDLRRMPSLQSEFHQLSEELSFLAEKKLVVKQEVFLLRNLMLNHRVLEDGEENKGQGLDVPQLLVDQGRESEVFAREEWREEEFGKLLETMVQFVHFGDVRILDDL